MPGQGKEVGLFHSRIHLHHWKETKVKWHQISPIIHFRKDISMIMTWERGLERTLFRVISNRGIKPIPSCKQCLGRDRTHILRSQQSRRVKSITQPRYIFRLLLFLKCPTRMRKLANVGSISLQTVRVELKVILMSLSLYLLCLYLYYGYFFARLYKIRSWWYKESPK